MPQIFQFNNHPKLYLINYTIHLALFQKSGDKTFLCIKQIALDIVKMNTLDAAAIDIYTFCRWRGPGKVVKNSTNTAGETSLS